MSNETLLFVDSRDCASFIDEGLGELLALPEDKIKMIRRIAKAPRQLSVDDELKALRKILNALTPVLIDMGQSVPIELITIVYCLAEMIALARDHLADGALVRLRNLGEDDPDVEYDLEGLHDELLAAAVREVLVVHGLLNMVLADHDGSVDLEWLREFGSRLITGEEAFGFSAELSKVLLAEESTTLLSIEEDELETTRYIVVTYESLSGDQTWMSRAFDKVAEAVRAQEILNDEVPDPDTGANPHLFSVSGDSPAMLTELAHQLWKTPPDTTLIAMTENKADYLRLVQSITAGVLEQDSPARILH